MVKKSLFLILATFMCLSASLYGSGKKLGYEEDFARALVAENGERNLEKASRIYLQLFQNPKVSQSLRWKARLRYGICALKKGQKSKGTLLLQGILKQDQIPFLSRLYIQKILDSKMKQGQNSQKEFSTLAFSENLSSWMAPKTFLPQRYGLSIIEVLQVISESKKNLWTLETLCLLDQKKQHKDKDKVKEKKPKKKKPFSNQLWKEIEKLRKETSGLMKKISQAIRSGEYKKLGEIVQKLKKKNQKLAKLIQKELKLRLENEKVEKVFQEILKEFQKRKGIPKEILKEIERARKTLRKELEKLPFSKNLELQRKELERFLKRLRENAKDFSPKRIQKELEKTLKENRKIFEKEWKRFQRQLRARKLGKRLEEIQKRLQKLPRVLKKNQKELRDELLKMQKDLQKILSERDLDKQIQKQLKNLEKLLQDKDLEKVLKESQKRIYEMRKKIEKLLKSVK
ncbi:MAG: hypothetical protein D6785_01595 [Planctomycetota bacterium]|nr:MAG: hypothetical protein D6785_01595 [Planctomycetota bacterium]